MDTAHFLQQQYRLRFEGDQAYRSEIWKCLCREVFQQWVSDQDTVLDLGCGWGDFINHIRCQSKWSMDLNLESAEHLSNVVHHLHMDCTQPWPIEPQHLDVVFSSNFLEHLPSKATVEQVVDQVHRGLKAQGLFILMGPNIRFLPGAYWDFWDHHTPLSERSLTELLQLKGFEILQCVDRFLPYTMVNTTPKPIWMLSVYLKLKCLWPLLGKQFLVIAKKKTHREDLP